jgi:hypothetical protein
LIEEDIVDVLTADPVVAALVAQRIYPLFRPQNDPLPAVVYQRLSTTPENSLLGFSGLDLVRVQFSCYAKTVADAKSLATAVRSALNEATELKGICVYEADEMDADTRNFRVFIDFNFWQRY